MAIGERLQTLEAEVSERDQRLQVLSAAVMKRDQRLQTLEAEVSERDQRLQVLSAAVMKRDQRLQALGAEVSERDQRLQPLRVQVAELDQQIQMLNAQVAARDWQVRVIESDYGWQLLRKVKTVRLWLVPANSRRERWYLSGLRLVHFSMFAGPSRVLRRGLTRVRRRADPGNLSSEVEKNGTSLIAAALPGAFEVSLARAETERPKGGKRVLVISGSTGDMERYRCHHMREQLQLFGIGCEVRSCTDPQVMALLPDYKLVILHRVAHDRWMEHLVAIAHKMYNATVIFDIDDLVFQPELDVWIHVLQIMSVSEQALFREGMQRYQRMIELCDGVLAATEPIAKAARGMGKPAWIHRNALSLEMLALSERAYRQRAPGKGKVVIGYASGTRTHNRDFAEAESALERILQTYPQTELWIIGHFDLDQRWDQWGARITRVPFVPWQQLPRTLASLDINLAPLEMHNPFCASKSELKYFEAAAVGVPTVASRWGAFAVAIQPGETGLLAGTAAEWYDALEQLVTNPALRRALGEQARVDVLRRYTPMAKGQELLAIFDDMRQVLVEKKGLDENLKLNSADDVLPQENQYGVVHPPLDGPLRFPEHKLAHQFLDGLKGLEIGAAAHNPFGLRTRNVAPQEDYEFYAAEARKLGVEPAPVDIVAFADDIPVADQSEDFILSSHVVEHLANVIKGFVEWNRIVRDGGYVFMIVPLKGALPADGLRELTPFDHFLADYHDNLTIATHPVHGVPGGKMGHYHTFTPDSLLAVVEWMKDAGLCDWELVAREDVDTKVGNGFTLVFR
ncbi:MAG: glycosyltransferase, partial [Deltaproteobacteria bacterium]|nr:glycosyltransferase [Deltaproteobacteria bacterium]